jgi:hypothetical protein
MILPNIETIYRDTKICYDAEYNNWCISDGYIINYPFKRKAFPTLKAAASFIDRKIAAINRIQTFTSIVYDDSPWNELKAYSKREVIGIIDENAVWLRVENRSGTTREKLSVGSHTLYEDSEKNWENVNKIEALEGQIKALKKERDSLVDMLVPIDLGAIIAKRQADYEAENNKEDKENEGGEP